MSNVKERILGAVTVMSEKDADTLWKIIIDNFSSWEDIEEIEPDALDVAMLQEIETHPDCKSFVSNDEAMKELGL
ncbi:MAG: hypothetical protein J1F01_00610 [Oscillospiraceae bacterium]|nr:hypothetical protein [Oscillospiraceae bacterium]